ncbi:methyltransferase domain-containing protein [Actinomadura roseirufa]|uniref:methyltransferase domain-containing protein n=1 Tax=Actinomadura roseirufa TaxID=2094049 RepID=UPI001041BBE9|nr:methyltransferase domain-containing protein [Actinomadura roseirufa]
MKASDIRLAVPREDFVPDVIWVRRDDGWAVPLSRKDDPEEWNRLVAGDDQPVITQVDDGATDKGTWPTSSGSSPEIMAIMIDALDVRPGMRVLEIGTGTGYNAAVLAWLLGTPNVTTVEIDATVAEHARDALRAAGYPVRVVTADGLKGHPENAPYDRIIVTAAVTHVPYAWVEQTKPGGMILAPWAPTFHPDWPLCRLTVQADATAEGRFIGPSSFMPMRGQRFPQSVMHEAEEEWTRLGEPAFGRFGVTVTPTGQQIWLDSKENVIK